MAVLQSSFSMAAIQHSLSFSASISSPTRLFLCTKFSQLRLTPTTTTTNVPFKTTTIRMGGGPRTYPGGVSKWKWNRMQARKSKQILRARLARERQIYEMRKRAELKAAISDLERPWEVVEKAPNLFSVGADEQVKVLADRFQRPEGFDLWSEEDGPELFKSDSELPSARFFPKGVVHSIKPYGKVENISDEFDKSVDSDWKLGTNKTIIDWKNQKATKTNLNRERNVTRSAEQNLKEMSHTNKTDKGLKDNFRKGNQKKYSTESEGLDTGKVRVFRLDDGKNSRRTKRADKYRRGNGKAKLNHSKSAVFDMSLQNDGSYEVQAEN